MSTFKDHFSSVATTYAANRPTYPTALTDAIAAVAPRVGTVLDVGCGTGQLSTLLAVRFARVLAIDPSPQQIAAATPHPRVSYTCARAEATGVADGCVDVVVAAQAAHWFDLSQFYDEVRRVCLPDAAIALVSYGRITFPDDPEPGARLDRFYEDDAGPHWPPERAHVEAGYRTLDFPFRELPAPELFIERRWTYATLMGYVDTWSALAGLRAARGEAPIAAFREIMADLWGDKDAPRRVRFPLALRLGRLD